MEAFRIKNNSDFENIATHKKQEAESMIMEFMNLKEMAKPDFCHCFHKGTFYVDFNHWFTLNDTSNRVRLVRSAPECQLYCVMNKEDCEFWTYVKNLTKCFMFDGDAIHATLGEDLINVWDIVSGPKKCSEPEYFSFCCGLGYGASVTITFFVVVISLVLLIVLCIFVCRILC